jgi:hypothetical protein
MYSGFFCEIFSASLFIPAKFALIWFSGFRGEDLNVIFYQNMSNLYNQYNYMAMSSLTYILGFSVRFFQPVYSV